jgi:hypothetical protein
MPQTHVSIVREHNISVVHGDFVINSRLVKLKSPRRETEDVVLARAIWLAQNVSKAAGERHLDSWADRN